jgi:hypothetical protein
LLKAANRNILKVIKCNCYRRTHPSKKALLAKLDENGNEIDDAAEESAPFGLLITFILYILIGSAVISHYEPDMDYFKAIYFNFITLTTIGLGDVIPQSGQHLPLTLCYVALGLALTTVGYYSGLGLTFSRLLLKLLRTTSNDSIILDERLEYPIF